MYIQKNLKKYFNDLASNNAVPGGGSASALAGVLGIALSSMVLNFTLSSKNYKKVHLRAKQLLKKNECLRKKIQLLIDKDVKAFLKLQKVIKLPKSSSQKSTLLEKSLKDAANVPYEICVLVSEAVKLADEIAKIGNINLISDTGAAMYLLEAAFRSAELNVKINSKYIKDKKFTSNKHKNLKRMSILIVKIKKRVINKLKGYF